MLRVRSNKTILGNSGATIVGCGFNISGDRNVIIRNLTFRNWNDDAINVQESATNIWIDHNSFCNGYDGAVDIKRGSTSSPSRGTGSSATTRPCCSATATTTPARTSVTCG